MRRLASGDLHALAPLYERHRGVVMRVLRQHMQGAGDLEDLCHDVFLALREMAARFRPGGSVRSLLVGIAVRKARKTGLGAWVRRNLLERRGAAPPAPATPHVQVDARLDADTMLRALPEEWRTVVVLHVVEGWTGEEIAEALGVSPNTVATRIWRARQRIRELSEGKS